MSRCRFTIALSLSLSFTLAAAAGISISQAQADGPKPCLASTFQVKKVEDACKSGGQPAAKKMMKAATDKAKAAGEQIDCKTCHKDLKTFELTSPTAVADLKKWI